MPAPKARTQNKNATDKDVNDKDSALDGEDIVVDDSAGEQEKEAPPEVDFDDETEDDLWEEGEDDEQYDDNDDLDEEVESEGLEETDLESEDEDWDDEDSDALSFLDEDEYEISDLDEEDSEGDEDATEVEDGEEDTDPRVRKLRNENAARRRQLRELREQSVGAVEEGINQYAAQLAETVGIEGDTTPDVMVEAVAERMAALAEVADKARRDLAIYRAAVPAGADMEKLSDSKSFTAALKKLDPNSESYNSDVSKAVSAVLEKNTHFKAAKQLDRIGGDFTGGTTPDIPEDSIEARAKRRRERRGVIVD